MDIDLIFKGTASDFLLVWLTSKAWNAQHNCATKGKMKLLLQRKENLEFIETRGGSWTVHRGRAHAFANGLEAILFCHNRHLSGMQVLATFPDSRMNFTMPVAT